MAARDKKAKEPDEPEGAGRLSGRVLKNRLAADCRTTKTKANFKLNILNPSASNSPTPTTPTSSPTPNKVGRPRGRPPASQRKPPDPESPSDPAAAKTRLRKKADLAEEEPPQDEPEHKKQTAATKPNVLKRIVKRKQLVSVLAKKKGLLAKRTLKTDLKKLPAKKMKKPKLTVKTEPEVEDDPAEPQDLPADVEIKKEPDAPEPDSRSSTPVAGRKSRTRSDIVKETDVSVRSTRSDRSNSPFSEAPQKLLRNGKQRTAKNSLLTEVVEQESKKRRLVSETKEPDALGKNPKRLRSHSKDGSEVSKSDIAESDVSFGENFEIDKPEVKLEIDPPKTDEKAPETDAIPMSDADVSVDGDNNNFPAAESEDPDSSETGANLTEKIVDKSLILDNMSKTFNDSTLTEKSKSNIRRSARQRKSTVKAKEHEETILAEKDSADIDLKTLEFILKAETLENMVLENSDINDNDRIVDIVSSPLVENGDVESEKISDVPDEKIMPDEEPSGDFAETASPVMFDPNATEVSADSGKLLDDCNDLNEEDEEKIDDSLKENIQNPYIGKSLTTQDIDKLMDKLKNFEEQDKKREEMLRMNNAEKRPVMVTNDVVLIPKSNHEPKIIKDASNTITKEKENIRNSIDKNPILVKKERKSFEIELPSSVTLIKRTGTASRKHSTGSNSKDGDSITMIDKSLGKEMTLDIRKSIEKNVLTIETAKTNTVRLAKAKDSTAASPKVPETAVHVNNKKIAASTSEIKMEVEPQTNLLPDETPEQRKEKEEVLKTLGLLTLHAASQAKLEKQKQKELIKTNKTPMPKFASSEGYTGTLKTVIKLNRPNAEKKKGRSPLKMTFQKSKSRGNKFTDPLSGDSESDENPCYTLLHKESGGSSGSGTGSSEHLTSGGHRKSHNSNRFNNHDSGAHDRIGDQAAEASATSKETTTNLVIPEKASSFDIHPERLCQDQCFYCGGKFGLFDTPCHIAQIKSVERQKKILDNEEKLTVDSCLCDACYRHVDRRANCPSYRKRSSAVPSIATANSNIGDICYANGCCRPAPHTLRRKWLVKIKRSISKVVQLDLDYPGLHTIPLCDVHYQAVSQLMICGLCKRRLSRNHVHYINQEYKTLNPLLHDQGLPIVLDEKPVVCKLCRYFCTLLLRPSLMQQSCKKAFLKGYRRRLMIALNLEVPDESDTDNTDEPSVTPEINQDTNDISKEKKRGKVGKNKIKKSLDNHKLPDENCLNNTHKTNWKKSNHQVDGAIHNSKGNVEDIETLISSNKIPVPCQTKTIDINDPTTMDFDNPLIALDKQSELQSLLLKCSVPSSTILQRIGITDSNQKSKNILKVHNAPAISKKKANRNLRRIQKLGQIITQKEDFEETLNCKIPNREDFTIEPMLNMNMDSRDNGSGFLRNIVLNDECTIETLPPKNTKSGVDINSLKNKWQMSESFSQIKKNLSVLSKNHSSEQLKKRGINHAEISNPVKRLETNPSISVRELFPGEEEMNLNCSIEFGNLKGITPEGWEKCNFTIQYDKYTKNLWNELQIPYGNQSSFLRHLILLEKYFRNGDLILSSNANSNAVTYSESVQNRLRSFDNIPTNGDVSFPYNLNNSTLSKSLNITPCLSEFDLSKRNDSGVEFRKPIMNIGAGKSLLKSNQNLDTPKVSKSVVGRNNKNSLNLANTQGDVPKLLKGGMPVSLTQLEKLKNQLPPMPVTPRPSTPRPESSKSKEIQTNPISDVRTSTPKADLTTGKPKTPSVPPELIAINPQATTQKKSIETVLKNIQLAKSSSQSSSQSVVSKSFSAISPVPSSTQQKAAKLTKDTKKGIKGTSKQWRPTLIPITNETKAKSKAAQLHPTADDRRLPSLVKVISAGKPYHITIQDYNRMCIMRREKLQQIQKAELLKNQGTSSAQSDVSVDSPAPKSVSPALPEIEKAPKPADPIIVPKTDDVIKPIIPDLDAASSLLKNVALKNITIAPITTAQDSKTTVTPSSPKSLLIPSALSVVPSAKLNSVKPETVINSEINAIASLIPKVIPITSQAVIIPKIPKSLTVIPQTCSTQPLPPPSTSPLSGSLTVLPVSTTITPAITASPSEP